MPLEAIPWAQELRIEGCWTSLLAATGDIDPTSQHTQNSEHRYTAHLAHTAHSAVFMGNLHPSWLSDLWVGGTE